MISRLRPFGPILLVFALAAVLRLALASREALWADELFSLAVATGHSLEHPAAAAVPALGDFVEPPLAVRPAELRRYLEHESPPAGPARIMRAVLMSDTSPPLYYLGLAAWTRVAGTGDLAMHAGSVAWALATFPLLWLLGRRLGGPREALIACALFALAPASVYYSVEARMYALVWFLSTLTVWLTVTLHDRGGAARLALWALVGAAGLLTHYFFVFVWAAAVGWLLVRPGQVSRGRVAAAVFLTLVAIGPWYRLIPASLAQWRVTGHWLDGRPLLGTLLTAPLTLGSSFVAGRGVWGGPKGVDLLALLALLVAGAALLRHGRAGLAGGGRDLLWGWVLAACVGPVVFDVLRGTATSVTARYALAGLPGALLLVGIAVAALPRIGQRAVLALLVLSWAPGLFAMGRQRSRGWEPYRWAAGQAGAWAGPRDLVLVHSIPSGVIGIARYLDRDVAMGAWVGQLGRRRVPDDLDALLAGRERVALIRVHDVNEPAPEEDWLRAHATVLREQHREGATITYFGLSPTRR